MSAKEMIQELQVSYPLPLITRSLLTQGFPHESPFHVLSRLYLCRPFKSFLTK